MQNFIRLKRYNPRLCLYTGIFAFLFIWQWNGLLYGLETGFDMGVQNMEMYTAISNQLHYGKDLLVTPYGPLGWMFKGIHISLTKGYLHTVFQTFLLNGLNALLRVSIIALFWNAATSKGDKVIASAASLCIFLAFPVSRSETLLNLCILLACTICVFMHMYMSTSHSTEKNNNILSSKWCMRCMAAIVGVLVALPPLVKFSYFMIAVALFIILSTIFFIRKRYIEIGVFLGTYFVTTVLLWVISGEKIQYLFSYFNAMLHFVSGYSEVMALSFGAYEYAFRDFMFAIFVCAIYGIMLLYLLFKNRFFAVSWFIISPLLFLIFKEAFVRSDAHTMGFANNFLYIICFLLYTFLHMHSKEGQTYTFFLKFGRIFWPVLLALLLLPRISAGEWNVKNQLYTDFHKLSSREKYMVELNRVMESAKQNPEYIALNQDIAAYSDKTLGMLSGEQSFFLAYDLMDRFKIDPMISLWENFTSESESLSARHYSRDNAPDVLLYRPEPLDAEYFPFRMGTILQSLLENYRVANINESGYLLLENQGEKHIKKELFEIDVPKQYMIGDSIEIPQIDDAHVFMRVDWEPTLLGQLSNFILKSPENRVQITTVGGNTHQYRFFRTLAQQGIYVSNYVDSADGLAEVFEGNANNSIVSIALNGNPLFYQKNFRVSFYGIPFTNEQICAKSSVATIVVNFSQKVPAGTYDVFWGENQLFGEKIKQIYIEEGQTKLSISIPSAGWNTLRLDFPSGIGGSYEIASILVDEKPCIIDTGNDVQITQTDTGYHITAGTYDPFIVFHREK